MQLTLSGMGGLKKPQGYWYGTVALHEIYWYHRSTKVLICRRPFAQLMHKITQEQRVHDLHSQVHTVQALQETTEYYMTCLLEDANLYAIYAKCVTIMPKDIHLVHHIHEEQT